MDAEAILAGLLDLAERLEVDVRQVYLADDAGGLCRLKGKAVLFVNAAASIEDRVAHTAAALASLRETEDCFVLPELRAVLQQYAASD